MFGGSDVLVAPIVRLLGVQGESKVDRLPCPFGRGNAAELGRQRHRRLRL